MTTWGQILILIITPGTIGGSGLNPTLLASLGLKTDVFAYTCMCVSTCVCVCAYAYRGTAGCELLQPAMCTLYKHDKYDYNISHEKLPEQCPQRDVGLPSDNGWYNVADVVPAIIRRLSNFSNFPVRTARNNSRCTSHYSTAKQFLEFPRENYA